MTTPLRVGYGVLAAVLAVLTFHQAMIALLWSVGIINSGPYPMLAVAPLGIPQIVNYCFWGGLYGALFGYLSPRFTRPLWQMGLGLGVLAALVGFFIVAPIKGSPIGGGWALRSWVLSLLINGFWGLGVGLIYSQMPGVRPAATA